MHESLAGLLSAYCYIARTPPFRIEGRRFLLGSTGVRLHADRLALPLRWQRPRRIFVNSLSDLFHEDVPDTYIAEVYGVMALARQHTFQVLTKRPDRRQRLLTDDDFLDSILDHAFTRDVEAKFETDEGWMWPLPNVHEGVSVENQRWTSRIEELLRTPAAVRFVSCEPLLGPVDLSPYLTDEPNDVLFPDTGDWEPLCLDWVIVGGESAGPANRALVERWQEGRGPLAGWEWVPKAKALVWVGSLRDQCLQAGVPFFFKQWGGPRPTSAGRILDGRTWDEFPAAGL